MRILGQPCEFYLSDRSVTCRTACCTSAPSGCLRRVRSAGAWAARKPTRGPSTSRMTGPPRGFGVKLREIWFGSVRELLGGDAAPTHYHPTHHRAARDTHAYPGRCQSCKNRPASWGCGRSRVRNLSLSKLRPADRQASVGGRREAKGALVPRLRQGPPPPPGPAGPAGGPLTGAPRPVAHERRPREWHRVRGLWRELLVRPADGEEAPLVRKQPARAGRAAPCGCHSTWCWMAALSVMEGWRKIWWQLSGAWWAIGRECAVGWWAAAQLT